MTATPRHYATAWYQLLAETPARERKKITLGFLKTLHARGALGILPEIVRAMEDIETAHGGAVAVRVTSARAIGAPAAKKIVTALTGNKHSITQKTDERLVGGVRIETKNRRWDVSVAGALAQLRKQLQ